ncbi:hypothetical protein B7486_57325, partial [cyanobacterium TDX16]
DGEAEPAPAPADEPVPPSPVDDEVDSEPEPEPEPEPDVVDDVPDASAPEEADGEQASTADESDGAHDGELEEDEEWDDEEWEWEEVGLLSTWRARILLGVGVLVVLALLVGGVLIVTGSDDEDEAAGGLDGVPTDTFNRRTTFDGVGVASNGDSWSPVVGIWGIDAGQVFMVEGDFGGRRNMLTLDMGSPDGDVAVFFSRVRKGAGVLFRYDGPEDYWLLVPVPDYGTWAVQHWVDDEMTFNENIGLAHSDDGTRAVMRLDGPEIEVQIDDLEPVTLDIGESDATGIGFTALGPMTNEARWDDLFALPR